jgi:aminobenzoyl-glutamate utilization protein B
MDFARSNRGASASASFIRRRSMFRSGLLSLATLLLSLHSGFALDRRSELKAEAASLVDGKAKLTQEMVDSIFSFGELGFQEFETSRYITGILEANGFSIERGVAGIPTAWVARWGAGKPVIALGTDIDCIPKASQKPGVAYHDPLVAGAPGHGEGHNSGQALNVTAALAVKALMEREHLPGTLMLWPGVAEEQLGSKAYYVRAGVFRDVDAVLYAHVSSNFGASWGDSGGSGLVSVLYSFHGESAHSAAAPWRGRSALDAVELMDIAMNMRREHLRLSQRTHYVITNGGDQPNVVPSEASVWYYFRETDYEHIRGLFEIGNKAAKGAAAMTDTEASWQMLGSAWPIHFNKTLAEVMYRNIQDVGLPAWSEADQTLAKGLQRELGVEESGLASEISELRGPSEGPRLGGPSDDIGDISWNVPTVTLAFPANIPGGPGHHWANAVAMATPIAHKGSTAGAMVMAMTVLDLLLEPELLEEAWKYFRDVQTKDVHYEPLIAETDEPPTYLNREIMETYREEMRKLYYDPKRYGTYLEQLGIDYPTVRTKEDH